MDNTFLSPSPNAPALLASVVIPSHGRRESLIRVLRALTRQTIPADRCEVIVICDGDVDGSADACHLIASQLPYNLQVIEQANQGPAAARNCGVQAARAELIVFLDDDVVPDEGLLAAHIEAHVGHDMRVTIGPLLPPRGYRLSPWAEWEERALLKQYNDMDAGRWNVTFRQFYTGNASVCKRHIIAVGGFDSSYRRAEDVELALRLTESGLHFVFLPQARGWHYIDRNYQSWLAMSSAYGAADYAMARAGRHFMLELVRAEYCHRHVIVRAVTQLCVGRPLLALAVTTLCGLLVKGAAVSRSRALGAAPCSIVFNLRYYDGLAAALGGRKEFAALLQGHSIPRLLNTVH